MTKGLRLLPWLQASRAQEPYTVERYFDCERCMLTTHRTQRQALGCGYEPPAAAHIPVVPWDHEGRVAGADEHDERGRTLDPVCPGYLCGLPEVIEASHARAHWKHGELWSFTGSQPTRPLLMAIVTLDMEDARCQDWQLEQQNGGR